VLIALGLGLIVGVDDGEFTPSGSRAESRLLDLGVAATGVRGPGEGHHSSKKPETRLGVAGAMLRGVLHRFEGDGGTLELLVSGDVALIGDCSQPTRPNGLIRSEPSGVCELLNTSGFGVVTAETGVVTAATGVVTAATGVVIAATGVVTAATGVPTGVEGCTGVEGEEMASIGTINGLSCSLTSIPNSEFMLSTSDR